MNSRHNLIKKMCIFIVLLSLGWVFPFITAQSRELGNMLNLIHIPTLIGGMILGPWYGVLLGVITPITRSFIFGMPKLYPLAICMGLELGTYGLISGLIFKLLKNRFSIKEVIALYLSLIIALLCGRIVWGVSRSIFAMFSTEIMTFKIFITSGFLVSWPGVLLQIIIIPIIYYAIKKTNLLNGVMI